MDVGGALKRVLVEEKTIDEVSVPRGPWEKQGGIQMHSPEAKRAMAKGYFDLDFVEDPEKWKRARAFEEIVFWVQDLLAKRDIAFIRDTNDMLNQIGITPQKLATAIEDAYKRDWTSLIDLAIKNDEEGEADLYKRAIEQLKVKVARVKGRMGEGWKILPRPSISSLMTSQS